MSQAEQATMASNPNGAPAPAKGRETKRRATKRRAARLLLAGLVASMNKDGSSPFFRPDHPNIMFWVFAYVRFFMTDCEKRSEKIWGRILATGLQRSFKLVSRAARSPSSLALLRCHRNNFSAPFHAKDMRASLPPSLGRGRTDGRKEEAGKRKDGRGSRGKNIRLSGFAIRPIGKKRRERKRDPRRRAMGEKKRREMREGGEEQ